MSSAFGPECGSVTIDRSHFDTLLRRAKFHDSNSFECYESTADSSADRIVTIPRIEYDQLHLLARQYANLRDNLICGGIDESTLAVLTSQSSGWTRGQSHGEAQGHSPGDFDQYGTQAHHVMGEYGPAAIYTPSPQAPWSSSSNHPSAALGHRPRVQESCDTDQDQSGGIYPGTNGQTLEDIEQGGAPKSGDRPHFECVATRTIQLCNLPGDITHADICDAVRGGPLVDIFIRNRERAAQVSFFHAEDAKAYHDHVRRHDLYIKQKRVEIRWAARQFSLPGHVASKIASGATRNIILRRIDGQHTEKSIRDDLEHIHNLVVVRIRFEGSSCYIGLNSVHNAMFARTCMMSRLKYKGSKIEWDGDECAQPLEKIQPRAGLPVPKKEAPKRVVNQFQLLSLDSDEDANDEDVSSPTVSAM